MHASPKILEKIRKMVNDYYSLAFAPVARIPMKYMETREHFRQPPENAGWQDAIPGTTWGGPWMTAWFSGTFKPTATLAGQPLFLRANTGGRESLVWVNNQPSAILTVFSPDQIVQNGHTEMLITPAAGHKAFDIAIEAYAWHPDLGSMPRHNNQSSNIHTFNFVEVATRRDDVWGLVFDLKVIVSLLDCLDANSLRHGKIVKGLADVFAVLPQIPSELPEDHWRPAVARARKILASLLKAKNGTTVPFIGLTGHSHMDTAWKWPVEETERKCARTYANALSLMEEYDVYRFVQSSSCHGDMMRRLYPQIFKGIQQMVKAGRWEPNGGSWIEPDCNIIGAEALIRQFLVGQTATMEMFNYRSDTFWMPDTFGYSAALPQILKSCDIDFFCTTKLSWNDTNRFPYDSFIWRGIDGTEVFAHFNVTHCWPDPQTLNNMWNAVQHKDIQDRRLCSYGYGDGGGGPTRGMVEVTQRVQDLEGCPRTKHMSVSQFLNEMQRACPDLPVWFGELYLELHRGTLTSIHGVKRGNRKGEVALQIAEMLCTRAALAGARYPAEELNTLWKTLLLNQFHDILPGSSIPQVNDRAIRDFAHVRSEAAKLVKAAIRGSGRSALELHNTLSWDRSGEIVIDAPGQSVPAGEIVWQAIENIEGHRQLALDGITVPALGSTVIPINKDGKPAGGQSPFTIKGNTIETPFAKITFDKAGGFKSFVFAGRQLVRNPKSPLNTFWIGRDIPKGWDNWDIDEDQALKMKRETRLLSRNVVAKGPLQLRIRLTYDLGLNSTLVQDVIFHATTPRVDFETRVDWSEKHAFLKAGFHVDVHTDRSRHEIQFGHAFRNTHSNLSTDRARFETSNHRWTDLSEPNFGVAILNDCKYGISVHGSDMRLSLLKAGLRPDPRGDEGVHIFTYSFLPHDGPFCAQSVIRPGYEANIPLVTSLVPATAEGSPSLLRVDNPAIIVESVKWAEDGNGFIVRLYEAEGNRSKTTIRLGVSAEVWETNMLEEKETAITIRKNACTRTFHPFEIKTLRCVPR